MLVTSKDSFLADHFHCVPSSNGFTVVDLQEYNKHFCAQVSSRSLNYFTVSVARSSITSWIHHGSVENV